MIKNLPHGLVPQREILLQRMLQGGGGMYLPAKDRLK